ncbi:hypothetical protein SAMN05216369_0650 [Marinobacter antarcticus]|uniref:Uncharacterized protein n=1 Tax=Marinobacter antarcticus TaxID=564117 RepID=A0A1M6Q1Z2_9GAMM|nr:hypothetical protein [Marinobacter antarcticus]SHK14258.1 hypothetical protein SAMN05216369_0650 [Marinobacter antarcticus]
MHNQPWAHLSAAIRHGQGDRQVRDESETNVIEKATPAMAIIEPATIPVHQINLSLFFKNEHQKPKYIQRESRAL